MFAAMMDDVFNLRPYSASDEAAIVSLWRRTWQQAYPSVDFAERVNWWTERWRNELVPAAHIVVAEKAALLAGFVTVDGEGYLDQLLVDPELWGSKLGDLLVGEAKRVSPNRITLLVNTDNARAIRFYTRNGFQHSHDDVNPISGRPVYGMKWTA